MLTRLNLSVIQRSKYALLVTGLVLLMGHLTNTTGQYYSPPNRETAISLKIQADDLAGQWTAPSLELAIKKYVAALDIWRRLESPKEEAQALQALGEAFSIFNKYKEAMNSFSRAETIYQKLQNEKGQAEILVQKGDVYLSLGEHQRAIHCSEQALVVDRAGEPRIRALAFTIIADATYFSGDFNLASSAAEQALPIWRSLGELAGQARILGRQAALLGDKGLMKEASEAREKSLQLWRQSKNVQGEANALTTIGSQLSFTGEYQKSLALHEQALLLAKNIGDRRVTARALGNLGYTYFNLGEFDRALDHYLQASKLFNALNNYYYEATILACMGDVYVAQGNAPKAMEQYKLALSTMERYSDRQWQALILNSIGSVQLSESKHIEAVNSYQKAVLLFHNLPNQRWESNSLVGLGSAYLNLKDIAEARECFDKALSLSRAASDVSGESLALYNLARIDRDTGNLETARHHIEAALKINENLRSKVVSQQSRAAYLGSVHNSYELYVDVLMLLHRQQPAHGFDLRALEAAERGKARTLVEMLVEGRTDIRAGVDPALLARERSLELQLASEAQAQLRAGTVTTRDEAVKERTSRLTAEYETVQAQIKAASQSYGALRLPGPLTILEAQQLVDPDTILVEFALGNERSFGWIVSSSSVTSFALPPRSKIETAARRAYRLLTTRNEPIANEVSQAWHQQVARADKEYMGVASELSRMLFAPLKQSLNCKRIVVVADGALHYIPFAALPIPTFGDERQLNTASELFATRYEMVSLPSAAVLTVQRRLLVNRREVADAVGVFADPVFEPVDTRVRSANPRSRNRSNSAVINSSQTSNLMRSLRDVGLNTRAGIPRLPFSRREAEAIFSLRPNSGSIKVLDFKASRTTLNNTDLSKFRSLHFATHGLLNSEQPELSGILLSLVDENGKRQDGFVTLHDIYRLNLRADLVVLSACQTALGKSIRGEGLVGMARAFMYAGAQRVVASLWKVDDAATAALMTQFYKEMFENGKSAATALREAQIHIAQQKQWSPPYYWAGFILQGDWK